MKTSPEPITSPAPFSFVSKDGRLVSVSLEKRRAGVFVRLETDALSLTMPLTRYALERICRKFAARVIA